MWLRLVLFIVFGLVDGTHKMILVEDRFRYM